MMKRLVSFLAALAAGTLVVGAVALAGSGASNASSSRNGKNEEDVSASSTPRVAVAEFADKSRARVDNLGSGFAGKLADRLAESGVSVVAQGEIEALMQQSKLDPTSVTDLSLAARELGADLLVRGTVESLTMDSAMVRILFITVTTATAHVGAHAELIDPSIAAVSSRAGATGLGQASGSLSVSLDVLFPAASACDVCGGGLRAEREAVADGELVSIGFENAGSLGWFGLEVVTADGTFLRWLGWRFIEQDACDTWFWNLRDALGLPVGPGTYVIRLRAGEEIAACVELEVRPSVSFAVPSLDLVTVGAPGFDAGSVGLAIDDAVNQLATALLPDILAYRGAMSAEATQQAPLLAQIAAVLPDGAMTINVGALDGVAVGDRFEVQAVDSLVFDPETSTIVSYNVIETKGLIEIVEVRDGASTGVRLGEFEPLVGDLARRAP